MVAAAVIINLTINTFLKRVHGLFPRRSNPKVVIFYFISRLK